MTLDGPTALVIFLTARTVNAAGEPVAAYRVVAFWDEATGRYWRVGDVRPAVMPDDTRAAEEMVEEIELAREEV